MGHHTLHGIWWVIHLDSIWCDKSVNSINLFVIDSLCLILQGQPGIWSAHILQMVWMSWPLLIFCLACSKLSNTSTTWDTCTGKTCYQLLTNWDTNGSHCFIGYVLFWLCRSVKASHVLISADGQVCLSGLRSIFSLIRHGQRAKVVHDFPQYSVKVLPWLSPEVLQQVLHSFTVRLLYDTASILKEKLWNLIWIVFFRICMDMTLDQTSTASASQPVNWLMAMCPLKTCQLRRWGHSSLLSLLCVTCCPGLTVKFNNNNK